jgi:hypothetical protein
MKQGRIPKVSEVLDLLRKYMRGKSFGDPLTNFRPAVRGLPVGGQDGKDIERSFTEVREDLKVLFEELVNTEASNINSYDSFLTQKLSLERRLRDLLTETEKNLGMSQIGGIITFGDSFTDLSKIKSPWTENSSGIVSGSVLGTTAEINLAGGFATLPSDKSNSIRYQTDKISIRKIEIPNGATSRGNFLSTFNDFINDAWFVTNVSGTIVIDIDITGIPPTLGNSDEVEINKINMELTSDTLVSIEWSNDGFNWNQIQSQNTSNSRSLSMLFNPVFSGFLRISLSPLEIGDSVGVKSFSIYKTGFDSSARLESLPYLISDNIGVSQAIVSINKEEPPGTSIRYSLGHSPSGSNYSDITWENINVASIPLSGVKENFLDIQGFQNESDLIQNSLTNLFIYEAPPSVDKAGFSSSKLFIGVNQFKVETFKKSWTSTGELAHHPRVEDWDGSIAVESGVMGLRSILSPEDQMGTDTNSFIANKDFIGVSTLYPGINKNTIYLPILPSQAEVDKQFCLQPGYNYRLTTYIYCSEPQVIDNAHAFILNPHTKLVTESYKRWASTSSYTTATGTFLDQSQASAGSLSILLNDKEIFNQIHSTNPTLMAPSAAAVITTGGTGLPAGAYIYAVSRANAYGETQASSASLTTTGAKDLEISWVSWRREEDDKVRTEEGEFRVYRKIPGGVWQLIHKIPNKGLDNPTTGKWRWKDNNTVTGENRNPPTFNTTVDLEDPSTKTQWNLIQGWNKVQFLVTIPNFIPGVPIKDQAIADSGIGIYIQPNLFSATRKIDYGISEQEGMLISPEPLKQVSDFVIRHNLAPQENNAWAWTTYQRSVGDNTYSTRNGILLNYDPVQVTGGLNLDGFSVSHEEKFSLYYKDRPESINQFFFRADFIMDSTAQSPPKLFDYNITLV